MREPCSFRWQGAAAVAAAAPALAIGLPSVAVAADSVTDAAAAAPSGGAVSGAAIRAPGPSTGWFVVGFIGVGAGSLVAVGSFLVIAAQAQPCVVVSCASSSAIDVGPEVALMAAGAIVALAGWYVMRASGVAVVLEDLPPPHTASSNAWSGRFETSREEQRAYPPATGLPILSGRF